VDLDKIEVFLDDPPLPLPPSFINYAVDSEMNSMIGLMNKVKNFKYNIFNFLSLLNHIPLSFLQEMLYMYQMELLICIEPILDMVNLWFVKFLI
jgi:hypothetical protein